MTAWVYRIDATDAAGSAVTVRLTTHNDPAVTTLDSATWWPVIAQLPLTRYDFFDGAFGGDIQVPSGTLTFRNVNGMMGAPTNWLDLRWSGARVRAWSGTAGAAWGSWVQRIDARVTGQPQVDGGLFALAIRPDERWLDQPLLNVYGGTGGADGPDALAGQPKPWLLGAPRFCPATLVDSDYLVWQLSDGAIQGVEVAFDRLARFGASSGNHASYAALIAASVPDGGWATCTSAGLVRHGAPHDGTPGWHVQGDNSGSWARKPGALLTRIAARKGVTAHATSMAALDSARPWNMSFCLREQLTARALVQQIAGDVAAVAGVDWMGQFWARPLGIGSAAQTLRADGTAMPPAGSVQRLAVAAPFWRLATQAEVTHAPVAASEAAYDLTYRAAYNALRVYRADDVVDMPDGSMWRFVGATPAAGSTPAAGNANWSVELAAAGESVVPTVRQELPPSDLANGYIWIRLSDNRQFRMEIDTIQLNGEDMTLGGDSIETGGFVAIVDADITNGLDTANIALAAAQRVEGQTVKTFTASYLGALDPTTQLPANIAFLRYNGADNVTATTTWSVASQGGVTGGTVTIADGVLTIPSGCVIPVDTDIVVRSLRDGVTIDTVLKLLRQDAAVPNTGATGSGTTRQDTTFSSISTASFVTISDTMVTKTGAGGTLTLSALLSTIAAAAANAGTFEVEWQWRYRPTSGGAWTNVTAFLNDQSASVTLESGLYFAENGTVNKVQTIPSLSATTDFDVELQARRTDVTVAKTINFSGTATAAGS